MGIFNAHVSLLIFIFCQVKWTHTTRTVRFPPLVPLLHSGFAHLSSFFFSWERRGLLKWLLARSSQLWVLAGAWPCGGRAWRQRRNQRHRHINEVCEARFFFSFFFLRTTVPRPHRQPAQQPAVTRSAAGIQQTHQHLTRMSGIPGNLDCEECLSPAQVANITELRPHPTVDEDDELLRYIWREYLHPKQYEWVLIVAYILVFFVSLIGNSLGELHLRYKSFPIHAQSVLQQKYYTLNNFFLTMNEPIATKGD